MSPGIAGLYVHAPYCARRCPYCDFAVEVSRSPAAGPWLDAVARELALVQEEGRFALGTLDTVFVGGGTPSLLGGAALAGLRELLEPWWPASGIREWTAEANPESFTPAVAQAWKAAGVTRVSLGVQSFDPAVLRWMGRLHGPEGARAAVHVAREVGMDNVSVDIIFGLPLRLGRDLDRDLDELIRLNVDHVSLYGLTAESDTPLARWVATGRETLADHEDYARQYERAVERLTAEGLEHYEVSNLARPGNRCLHNERYWDGSPYLGLGIGAHSYRDPVRRWNVRGLDAYLAALERGRLPVQDEESLGPAEARLERLWLGLRTAAGVPLAELGPRDLDRVRTWSDRGWARLGGNRARLTASGWLLPDALTVELDGR